MIIKDKIQQEKYTEQIQCVCSLDDSTVFSFFSKESVVVAICCCRFSHREREREIEEHNYKQNQANYCAFEVQHGTYMFKMKQNRGDGWMSDLTNKWSDS